MANSARIQCINKTNRNDPHDRIHNVGGTNPDGTRWKWSQQKAIQEIESGQWQFHVTEAGKTVKVIVAKHNSNKYIKTEADGVHPDNLLALPECP
jgi:hypothetical protein